MSKIKNSQPKIGIVQLLDAYHNVLSCGFTVVKDMLSDMTSALQESPNHIHDSSVTSLRKMRVTILQMHKSIDKIRK